MERENLNSFAWYRFLKVIYIGALIFFVWIFGVIGYEDSLSVSDTELLDRIVATNEIAKKNIMTERNSGKSDFVIMQNLKEVYNRTPEGSKAFTDYITQIRKDIQTERKQSYELYISVVGWVLVVILIFIIIRKLFSIFFSARRIQLKNEVVFF